jgi:hypothetical protein
MAGGSRSEEMDAFDDVTPAKPVSIYDLDEDLPTRAQSSEEIAEFQQKAREKREAAFRSFRLPTEPRPSDPGAARPTEGGSGSNPRPIPRESGPVLIDRLRVPPPVAPESLDQAVSDVAATLDRLPAAPKVPVFDPPRGSLETIPTLSEPPALPSRRRRWLVASGVAILVLAVLYVALTFFR